MTTKYTVVPTPQSNEELKQWIQDWIGFVNEASDETLGVSGTTLRKPKRDHGHPSTWNTELITDMSQLFFCNEWGDTTFNEDISSWDTSNVINMRAVKKLFLLPAFCRLSGSLRPNGPRRGCYRKLVLEPASLKTTAACELGGYRI